DTDGNRLAGWERGLSCVSLVPAAKWVKLGKYADEALAFAGKLDDKLAKTLLGEGIQTAKRKLEDLFSRGKQVACGCNSRKGFLKIFNPPAQNTVKPIESYLKTVWGNSVKGLRGRNWRCRIHR